ncbi:probable bifunctional methylenetetrahydrofolate dehydrogenase/cyclohydrolase 2 isoform X4 [Octodon degus]|uniref:methenyltetrahydrofolate cyclohydrolase n=1 Tax=Octodon degus TaxID=10160 RepID=A0A6P6E9S9_OCTDE|nr:probable bifunctional methylenetetrahydrofolate dehydrogenase/cyclohydrolase 2 isoform X4 [Octodon degus]
MALGSRGFSLLRGHLGGRAMPSGTLRGAARRGPEGRRESVLQRSPLSAIPPVCPLYSHLHEATVISGTEMAKQIQKEVQRGVEAWLALGHERPHLSIVLVGDNPASHTYVRNKIRAASAIGICSELILKPKEVSQEELLDITDQLNMDPKVSGILVQLPLPEHVDERTICNGIAPGKDVDGFHIINVGRLCLDQHSFIPATAGAVWEIIKRTGIETFGKSVVVVGRSKHVGLPIAMLLHTDGDHERPGGDATVTIAHRYTPREQLKTQTRLADIVVVAAAVRKKASFITPVPGGVGPVTVATLLRNTLLAAQKVVY